MKGVTKKKKTESNRQENLERERKSNIKGIRKDQATERQKETEREKEIER